MRSSFSAVFMKRGSRGGPRLGVQHDVPRDRAHHSGFGPDDCRRSALSDLHPTAYFQSLGIPAGIGVLVAVVAALTLAPALLVIGRHFGLFEPARPMRTQGWRRIGTAIVRWPGPILAATIAIALVGLLALPGYKTSYDAKPYLPARAPANVGYAAAERHFSQARLNPELLMIEADHDLRNPTDMILLERVAKAVFHTDGIAQVQSITRPLGTPLDHTSIPFQISAQKRRVRSTTWHTSRPAPPICSSRSR